MVSRWHSKEVVGDPHVFYYFHFHRPFTSAMMLSKFSLENKLSTYCDEGNSGSRDVQYSSKDCWRVFLEFCWMNPTPYFPRFFLVHTWMITSTLLLILYLPSSRHLSILLPFLSFLLSSSSSYIKIPFWHVLRIWKNLPCLKTCHIQQTILNETLLLK